MAKESKNKKDQILNCRLIAMPYNLNNNKKKIIMTTTTAIDINNNEVIIK